MDKRSWMWKKKSSHKTVTVANSTGGSSNSENQQDNSKKLSVFVQVSQERYDHLSGLEDHVKVLNEKLSCALSEITNKENLVKQHAKVAEEAVTGWEKAESETSALKVQLESVTLLKLTAEERVSQLDAALKECVKQIRTVKEDGEQKLHDVVFTNNKQWEKVKYDLESKVSAYEQELLQCSAENDRLSGTLEERSNMLMKINEEKCQADAEIQILKTNIQSCEREISSLKYEVHIMSKELEIRTEEKNMSMRSAEVSNKQHLEDVKKIAKLESECQRLRSLVRKKLPGPAALAQMKLEVEGFGRDYREPRVPRSPARNSSPRLSSASEFALENMHQCQRENEFLTARLLEMEEDTKMLKEALSKRNGELQVSRNMFSKTASKLRAIETNAELDQQKYQTRSRNHLIDGSFGGSNQPGMTSMSEDGIDEDISCSEKWSTMWISDDLSSMKEKPTDKISVISCSSHMELMDDFLEMEKLACSSVESSGVLSVPEGVKGTNKFNGTIYDPQILSSNKSNEHQKAESLYPELSANLRNLSASLLTGEKKPVPVSQIMSTLAMLIELLGNKNGNTEKLLTTIKSVVFDVQEELGEHPENHIDIVKEVESVDASCGKKLNLDAMNADSTDKSMTIEDLKGAISKIHEFVQWLGKEYIRIQGLQTVNQEPNLTIKDFTCCVNTFLRGNLDLQRFTIVLSCVLSKIKELNPHASYQNFIEGECNGSECVDKVTLLENKVVQQEVPSNGCTISSTDHIATQGAYSPGFGQGLSEDFEQLKGEKTRLALDLDRLSENLDETKCHLQKKEQEINELKSELAVSQNSNSLAETQLKCMAESYKSIESRCQEMEREINRLEKKAGTLENELISERLAHQTNLNKLKDLQEQIERNEQCAISEAVEMKEKQGMEITAAAEKLAECQETIFLLGRQLKALHPQAEAVCSPSERNHMSNSFMDDLSSRGVSKPQGSPHISQRSSHGEMENIASILQQAGGESPYYNSSFFANERSSDLQSPSSSQRPKHRSTLSSSSSSSLTTSSQKQGRGLSRFFSKGK